MYECYSFNEREIKSVPSHRRGILYDSWFKIHENQFSTNVKCRTDRIWEGEEREQAKKAKFPEEFIKSPKIWIIVFKSAAVKSKSSETIWKANALRLRCRQIKTTNRRAETSARTPYFPLASKKK